MVSQLTLVPDLPDWTTISNLKQLAIIGEELAMAETAKGVDRDACFQALFNVMAQEAEKLEDFYDTANTPNFGALGGKSC